MFDKTINIISRRSGVEERCMSWDNCTTIGPLHWDVAKVFAYEKTDAIKISKKAEDVDMPVLCNMMYNCDLFTNAVLDNDIDQIRKARNWLFHTAKNTVKAQTCDEYFDSMLLFLDRIINDPEAGQKVKLQCQNGRKSIAELKEQELGVNIFEEAEKALREKQRAVENELHDMITATDIDREKLKEVLKVQQELGKDFVRWEALVQSEKVTKQQENDLKNEREEMKKRTVEMTSKIEKLENECTSLKAKCESMTLQLNEMKDENTQLKNEISATRKCNEMLRTQINDVMKENEEKTEKISLLQNEKINLQHNIETFENENAVLLQKVETLERKNGDILQNARQLNDENDSLRKDLKSSHDENELFEKKVNQLTTENKNLTDENDLHKLENKVVSDQNENLLVLYGNAQALYENIKTERNPLKHLLRRKERDLREQAVALQTNQCTITRLREARELVVEPTTEGSDIVVCAVIITILTMFMQMLYSAV